jgi:hypothetical protein
LIFPLDKIISIVYTLEMVWREKKMKEKTEKRKLKGWDFIEANRKTKKILRRAAKRGSKQYINYGF